MQHDNSANQANFDELQAHCNAISAKLTTAHGAERELLLADQTDYWERSLQIYRMARDTFQIERDEARLEVRELQRLYARAYWHRTLLCAAIAVAAVLALTEVASPGATKLFLDKAPLLLLGSYAVAGGIGAALYRCVAPRRVKRE